MAAAGIAMADWEASELSANAAAAAPRQIKGMDFIVVLRFDGDRNACRTSEVLLEYRKSVVFRCRSRNVIGAKSPAPGGAELADVEEHAMRRAPNPARNI
jgi:hypothetical protein